jgi:hypothetical protein
VARGRRISDRQRKIFLATLRQCGIVAYAAPMAGVHRGSLYRLRQQDEAFRNAWSAAIAILRSSGQEPVMLH